MKQPVLIPIIAAVAALLLLAGILFIAGSPSLYEAKYFAYSETQKDPSTVAVMTTEESATIRPLMEGILGGALDVTIEIDARDAEFAARELSSYANLVNRLKSNSITLKLTGTDINDFRLSAEALDIAMNLINDDMLKLEELRQYVIANAGNKQALYAIANDVLQLGQEIQLTSETYAAAAQIMIEVAERYDISTETIQKAITVVNGFAYDLDNDISRFMQTLIDDPDFFENHPDISEWSEYFGTTTTPKIKITFNLRPEEGVYGDTIIVDGTTNAEGEHAIYLDSDVWGKVNPNQGTFSKSFTIGKISTGIHIVSVRYDSYMSKLAYFIVHSSPTVLTITGTSQSDGENARLLTVYGTLTTEDGIDVSGAPITVINEEDGTVLMNALTTAKGTWQASAELEDGEYTIYAMFSDASFPLKESQSDPITVAVYTPIFYYLILIAAAGVFVFLIIRVVRIIKSRKTPEHSTPITVEETHVEVKAPDIVAKTVQKLKQIPLPKKMPDSVVSIYQKVTAVLAQAVPIENIKVKTPREILRMIPNHSSSLKTFMERYEFLHYSGEEVRKKDISELKRLAESALKDYIKEEEK